MATVSALREDIRFLVNDPSTAPNNLYSDAEILDAINRSYRQLANTIRVHSPGYFQKLGYLSSSTSSFSYTLPTDLIRLQRVRIDTSGTDLSANPGATTAEILGFVPPDVFHEYQSAGSGTRTFTVRHRSLQIAPAFSIAATNSIELWYEYEPTALTADTNSPDFAANFHDVLIPMAARWLKASKNLDTSFEEGEINMGMMNVLMDLKQLHTETQQFRTSLHRDANYYSVSGDGVSPAGTHGNG